MEELLTYFNEFGVAKCLAGLLALFIVGVCVRLTAREVLHPA